MNICIFMLIADILSFHIPAPDNAILLCSWLPRYNYIHKKLGYITFKIHLSSFSVLQLFSFKFQPCIRNNMSYLLYKHISVYNATHYCPLFSHNNFSDIVDTWWRPCMAGTCCKKNGENNKLQCRWKYIVWSKWYSNATGCLNTIT